MVPSIKSTHTMLSILVHRDQRVNLGDKDYRVQVVNEDSTG